MIRVFRVLRLHASILAVSVLLLLIATSTAYADGASIGLYTDSSGQTCSFGGNAPGVFSAYVVYRPDVNGVTAVQFAAPVPSCLGAIYVGETVTPGLIAIGDTQGGISVALPGCTRQPISVVQISYFRTGSTELCCPYPIVLDPSSSGSVASDCAFADVPATLVTSHFNADASCECVGNSPPDQPTNPDPFEGQASVVTQPLMSWYASDFDNNLVDFDVYLGTTPSPPLVASHLAGPTFTPAPLTSLTQHYWRVVARDAVGLETSSPLWSFMTRPANTPPVTPFNPVPANAAQNVVLNQILSWTSGDLDGDPVEYDVYFGTTSPPPLAASDLTVLHWIPGPLAVATTYYWRVVARDPSGAESSGPQWSFTSRPSNLPPNEPGIVSPWSPSTGVLLNQNLVWTGSDPDNDPLRYDVYFGTSSPPPLVASNIVESTYDPALSFETTYYWRIVARDLPGATTSGSTWTFTTRPANYPPNVPTSPSPPNNAIDRLTTLTLTWQSGDLDNHTVTYDVYFGTEISPPLVATNVTVKSYPVTGLAELTTYRWKIVARDQLGAETAGPVWLFTTKTNGPPVVPFGPSPSNGATNRPIYSTLSWGCSDADGDPITYDVYFGTVNPPALVASAQTPQSYNPGTLAFSTAHYWRIVAHDDHAHETSSPTWSFTTKANSAPLAPSSPNPLPNALVATSPTLTWFASDVDLQPLTYNVYFGNSSPPPLVATGLTDRSYVTPNLPVNSGDYYWRIEVSDGIASTLGTIWRFTMIAPGDVVRDGVINVADANCAMQIYLLNPSCGGTSGPAFADVDCSGIVTPGDAGCIHRFAIDGSCTFCGVEPTAPAMTTLTPAVAVGSVSTQEGTLTVNLSVSNVSSLRAFGFRVNTSKFTILQALRLGPTTGFTAFGWANQTPQSAVVGAYSLTDVSLGSTVEFVQLKLDMSRGLPETIVISAFVDDLSGMSTLTIPLGATVDVRPVAAGVVLNQNHPNPFNPQTTISYELPASASQARVRLWVLDISGRVVRSLVDEDQTGGAYEVRWDGRDDDGAGVSSGVYFYVLDAMGERQTRKLVLLK